MIPIVAIGNLLNGLASVFIAARVYVSYQKTEGATLSYFYKTFLYLTIYFILVTSPGLVFNSPFIVGLSIETAQFFLLLSTAFFIIIPLEILGWLKAKKCFFWLLVMAGIIMPSINVGSILAGKEPAIQVVESPFVYWESNRDSYLSMVQGGVIGIGVLLAAIFFMVSGFRCTDKYLRTRSFILSVGLLFLTLAGVLNFVWGAAASNIFMPSIVSAVISIIGLLIILRGIFYKKRDVSPDEP